MSVDADVVVVGAGMAGLAAADRLTAAGMSTLVIEARDRPGGRVRAEGGLQVGGEFVGRSHRRLHDLIVRTATVVITLLALPVIALLRPSRATAPNVPSDDEGGLIDSREAS